VFIKKNTNGNAEGVYDKWKAQATHVVALDCSISFVFFVELKVFNHHVIFIKHSNKPNTFFFFCFV